MNKREKARITEFLEQLRDIRDGIDPHMTLQQAYCLSIKMTNLIVGLEKEFDL